MGDMNARTRGYEDVAQDYDIEEFQSLPVTLKCQNKPLRNNQDKKGNNYGKKLIELCQATNSYILNGRTLGDLQGKYTCYEKNGCSTVDYAIANDALSKYVKYFYVSNPSISDHCDICIHLNLPGKVTMKNNTSTLVEAPRKIRWNEETRTQLLSKFTRPETELKVQKIASLLKCDEENIDQCADLIQDLYVVEENKKRVKKKSPPNKKKQSKKKWYDKSCYEMSQRLKQLGKLISKDPGNPHLRGNLCVARKEYKKQMKKKKAEWKNGMIRKLEEAENANPKEYWNIIKDLREKQKENHVSNAEDFKKFYEKLFAVDRTETNNDISKLEQEVTQRLANVKRGATNITFSMEQFQKALQKLKNNKATGVDGVPAEMLKESPEPIQKLILCLINKIVKMGYYPKKWAIGITSLLLKEGDDEDPNNYRAKTVGSAITKILATLLDDHLDQFSNKNKIMNPLQIAFKKKSRPADHLLVLKHITDS